MRIVGLDQRILEVKTPSLGAFLVPSGLWLWLWVDLAPKRFSPWNFLVLAWAKSDFGLTLKLKVCLISFIEFSSGLMMEMGSSRESRGQDLLRDLFVAQCRKLCGAGTHDGVGRGDVLLGTKIKIKKDRDNVSQMLEDVEDGSHEAID